jgi:hypothetical protein
LVLVASSLLLSACGGDSNGTGSPSGVECTTEARASVQVTVVDVMGVAVLDATVTFSVDGGVEEDAECVRTAAAGGCEEWVAGFERAGAFVVRAVSADGATKDEESVTVTKDECHVTTQTVTLTLM